MTLNSVKIIIKLLQKAIFRKKLYTRLIIYKIIHEFIDDTIIIAGLNKISIIEKYLQTIKVQR